MKIKIEQEEVEQVETLIDSVADVLNNGGLCLTISNEEKGSTEYDRVVQMIRVKGDVSSFVCSVAITVGILLAKLAEEIPKKHQAAFYGYFAELVKNSYEKELSIEDNEGLTSLYKRLKDLIK